MGKIGSPLLDHEEIYDRKLRSYAKWTSEWWTRESLSLGEFGKGWTSHLNRKCHMVSISSVRMWHVAILVQSHMGKICPKANSNVLRNRLFNMKLGSPT